MKTELLKLSPKEFCRATKACEDGAKYALKHKTMRTVWDNCQRVDWLIWILNEIDAPQDEKASRLFMVWCGQNTPLADGRTTGALLTEQASRDALVVAVKFAAGECTQEELSAAESAARSAAWSAQSEQFKKIVKNPFL